MKNKITLTTRIINKIKRYIHPEKQFYVDLFINNEKWNTKGPNYEESLRWQIIQKFVLTVLESNSKYQNKQMDILDIGCGRGWLSNLLSGYGKVKALEPVGEVARFAKKLFPHLDISRGTTDKIIATDKSRYDLIVCSEVIEHIPDNKKMDFCNDLFLLTNQNGYLVITTPRKEAEPEWKKYHEPGQPIEDWMTENEVASLFGMGRWKKIDLERFAIQPAVGAPHVEIYQLWLFQKHVLSKTELKSQLI